MAFKKVNLSQKFEISFICNSIILKIVSTVIFLIQCSNFACLAAPEGFVCKTFRFWNGGGMFFFFDCCWQIALSHTDQLLGVLVGDRWRAQAEGLATLVVCCREVVVWRGCYSMSRDESESFRAPAARTLVQQLAASAGQCFPLHAVSCLSVSRCKPRPSCSGSLGSAEVAAVVLTQMWTRGIVVLCPTAGRDC